MYKNFVHWYLPAVLWGICILALTSFPTLELPDIGLDWADKIYHFVSYFVLGFLILRALGRENPATLRQVMLKALGFGVTFAILTELYQFSIPGREFDLFDALANVTGILAGEGTFFFTAR